MGDGEITEIFRKKLIDDLDHLQLAFVKMSELYRDCLQNYVDMLQSTIAKSDSYLSQNELIKLHQTTEKGAQTKVYNILNQTSSIFMTSNSFCRVKNVSFQKERKILIIKWYSLFNEKLKMKSMESFLHLNNPMNQNELNLM